MNLVPGAGADSENVNWAVTVRLLVVRLRIWGNFSWTQLSVNLTCFFQSICPNEPGWNCSKHRIAVLLDFKGSPWFPHIVVFKVIKLITATLLGILTVWVAMTEICITNTKQIRRNDASGKPGYLCYLCSCKQKIWRLAKSSLLYIWSVLVCWLIFETNVPIMSLAWVHLALYSLGSCLGLMYDFLFLC